MFHGIYLVSFSFRNLSRLFAKHKHFFRFKLVNTNKSLKNKPVNKLYLKKRFFSKIELNQGANGMSSRSCKPLSIIVVGTQNSNCMQICTYVDATYVCIFKDVYRNTSKLTISLQKLCKVCIFTLHTFQISRTSLSILLNLCVYMYIIENLKIFDYIPKCNSFEF